MCRLGLEAQSRPKLALESPVKPRPSAWLERAWGSGLDFESSSRGPEPRLKPLCGNLRVIVSLPLCLHLFITLSKPAHSGDAHSVSSTASTAYPNATSTEKNYVLSLNPRACSGKNTLGQFCQERSWPQGRSCALASDVSSPLTTCIFLQEDLLI